MRGDYSFVLDDSTQVKAIYSLLDKMRVVPPRDVMHSAEYRVLEEDIELSQKEIDSTGVNTDVLFITGIAGWRGVTISGERYGEGMKLRFSSDDSKLSKRRACELADRLTKAA